MCMTQDLRKKKLFIYFTKFFRNHHFSPIIYYTNDNKDYIKMSQVFKTHLGILQLSNYEFCYFMGSKLHHMNFDSNFFKRKFVVSFKNIFPILYNNFQLKVVRLYCQNSGQESFWQFIFWHFIGYITPFINSCFFSVTLSIIFFKNFPMVKNELNFNNVWFFKTCSRIARCPWIPYSKNENKFGSLGDIMNEIILVHDMKNWNNGMVWIRLAYKVIIPNLCYGMKCENSQINFKHNFNILYKCDDD